MTWQVLQSDQVSEWLDGVDDSTYEQVIAALLLLTQEGPQLGRPLVDTITGSAVKNMKELRAGSSGRSEIRILFAFDHRRQAILLLAGDKAGNWRKWYRTSIPLAEEEFARHREGDVP